MGMGPWAQADLVRDIEKTERNRFRRALAREEKYLRSLITSRTAGGIMRGDLEGAFHRIRSKIAGRKPVEKPKAISPYRQKVI